MKRNAMPLVNTHRLPPKLIFQSSYLSQILCVSYFLQNSRPFLVRKVGGCILPLSIQTLQAFPWNKSSWANSLGKLGKFS